MAGRSRAFAIKFLKLVGPELTARDIIHRLLPYLHNHVIDAANITICIPQYGDNHGKAINISSKSNEKLVLAKLQGIKLGVFRMVNLYYKTMLGIIRFMMPKIEYASMKQLTIQ